MTRGHFTSRTGFTLVELLIGATLSAMVMAGVLSSYIFMGRQLARLANQQTLETEGRRTLAYFDQDVRMASSLGNTPYPSATRMSLTVPTGTGNNIITYYYNSDLLDPVTVNINGTNVIMPAATLTRCVYNGTSVTSLILLRYITDGDVDEADNDLQFRYYDTTGNEYTSATLNAGSYLTGIKQIALEFRTQTGTEGNGTQTKVYSVASNRLILRNRALLQ